MFASAWVSDGSTNKYQTTHLSNTQTNSWNESLPLSLEIFYFTKLLQAKKSPSLRLARRRYLRSGPCFFLFLQHISVKCTNSFDSNVLVHEINQTIWFNRHVWGIYLYVWWLFLSTKCPRYILVVDMSFPAHLRDCNVWDLETLGQTSLRNQLLVCYLHGLELPQLRGPCICPPNSDSTQPCSSHLRCCTIPNISHLATRGLLHKILN